MNPRYTIGGGPVGSYICEGNSSFAHVFDGFQGANHATKAKWIVKRANEHQALVDALREMVCIANLREVSCAQRANALRNAQAILKQVDEYV